MPVPLIYVAGAAVISIGATAAAWYYNTKTEEEKRRQENLRKEKERAKQRFQNAYSQGQSERQRIQREYFFQIKKRYLEEICYFRQSKASIKEELNRIKVEIQKELSNESITPYQRQTLLKSANQAEDAFNRLDAYWQYLSSIERELEKQENNKTFHYVDSVPVPKALLPEDFIYVGKIAYVRKNEIALEESSRHVGWNSYSQRLELTSQKDSLGNWKHGEEEKLYQSYSDKEEFLIVVDRESKQTYFKCSIAKGLLYQHILDGFPFEVRPEKADRVDKYFINVLFHDLRLTLDRKEKCFPLKKYSPNHNFEVKVLEHDLLLKDVKVTEKIDENRSITSQYAVSILYDAKEIKSEKLVSLDEDIQRVESLTVIHIDIENRKIVFRGDRLQIETVFEKDRPYFQLVDISEYHDEEGIVSRIFAFPYQVQFIETTRYDASLELGNEFFQETLDFIIQQNTYISHTQNTDSQDYLFFKKWESIVAHQIEENTYESIDIDYKSFSSDHRTLFFYIESDTGKNILRLSEGKNYYDVFVSLGGINIGYLSDIKEDMLKIDVDLLSKKIIERVPESGILTLKIKTFQAALQRQKKALKDFANGNMVNENLKNMLISPALIHSPSWQETKKIVFQNNLLTENQKEIVRKALNEKHIFLIQGPPGTGKTTVINELVYQTLERNSSSNILIVSQQNVAVDNSLERIYNSNREKWFDSGKKSLIRIVRDESKVASESIKPFTLDKWFDSYKSIVETKYKKIVKRYKNGDIVEVASAWWELINKEELGEVNKEILEVLISSHSIIGATCVGLANKQIGLDLFEFDLAIIDEAGRSTAPELLIPILRAKKIIVIGDHYQLPPNVDRKLLSKIESDNLTTLSEEDIEILEKSFFEKLFEEIPPSNKGMLNEQFRMPEEIGNLISKLFYHGELKNGYIKSQESFLHPNLPLSWVDVQGYQEKVGTSSFNIDEVNKIVTLVAAIEKTLQKKKIQKDIAIITPYSAQKHYLREALNQYKKSNYFTRLKIDTVDSFQGEEADVVIYSTVKTYGNISFLLDRKRLNVAISRTKENLIFVGDKEYLYNYKNSEVNIFKVIIDTVRNSLTKNHNNN